MAVDWDKEIKEAIRHDLHKIHGRKHTDDKKLSTAADKDASKMSRKRLGTVVFGDDVNNYRCSLIDGKLLFQHGQGNRDRLLVSIEQKYMNDNDTSEIIYRNLLKCELLSIFNESPDLPITSLKYHTILTAALHYNYMKKHSFKELYFGIMNLSDIEEIFEVIYCDENNGKCFVIRASADKMEAFTQLGVPKMNFGDAMSRLGNEVYIEKSLYANLRRIKAWSTGLQFYEDINRGSL